MSVSIREAIEATEQEVEQLKRLLRDYPDAQLVSGRLYRVGRFKDGTVADRFVVDGDHVLPCIAYGDPDQGVAVYLIEARAWRVTPTVALMRVFHGNPEAVMAVLR